MANEKSAEISYRSVYAALKRDEIFTDSSDSDEIDVEHVDDDEREKSEGNCTEQNNTVNSDVDEVNHKVSEETVEENNCVSFCQSCILDDTSDSEYEIDVVGEGKEGLLRSFDLKERRNAAIRTPKDKDAKSPVVTNKDISKDENVEVIYLVETNSLAKYAGRQGEKLSGAVKLEKHKSSKCHVTKERKRVSDKNTNKKVKHVNADKQTTKTSTKNVGHKCTHEGCGKVFSKPCRLVQHARTHTGERPFVCPLEWCLRSFTRHQHLKRHMVVSHQDHSEDKKFQCDMCGKMFANVYSLKKHRMRYHERTMYKCEFCRQLFRKQQHLRTHSYLHTGIKPYNCEFPGCDMRCETPSKLKRHSMIHQKNRYGCPQEACKQAFDTYNDLRYHLSISHPKVCDICGRPFKQLRKLRMHRKTHDNAVEAYFCPFATCDKHFYYENNLRTHIKDKHEEVNIYECGTCSKRLSTKQKLRQHMKTHEPDYQRNYASKKPRKTRKDKGTVRRDLPRLLSGYWSDDEDNQQQVSEDENCEDDSDMEVQPQTSGDSSAGKDPSSNEKLMDMDCQ